MKAGIEDLKAATRQDRQAAYRAAGYGGVLRRAGKSLQGLCELHADTDASFTVFLDGGFKCFGCGARGSIVDFYMAKHGLADFRQACDELAPLLGVNGKAGLPKAKRNPPREVGRKRYPIRDAEGRLVAEHIRIDFADTPKKMWWERDGKKGLAGMPLEDLPLYRLPDLLSASESGTVIVVEGEKAADACAERGVLAVATTCGASSVPSPDALRPLAGHDVVLWADADDDGHRHMQALSNRLLDMGCSVRLLLWREAPPKGDAADFFIQGGTPESLQELIASAQPAEKSEDAETPGPQAGRGKAGDATTRRLADAILEEDRFAVDGGGGLFVYRDGAYRPHGESVIRRRLKTLLHEWELDHKWSTHKQEEVVEYIRVDAPQLWAKPPLDLLNCANGLLALGTAELRPHSPDFLSPLQLPVAYDGGATCPAWERFVEEIFPEDCQSLPWELVAWLMAPFTSIQKAVLLLGEGANGKSTFLAALTAFLGRPNCAAVSLHKLEADRFAAARLVGKLANICPDLPSAHLTGTSTFKAIVGGDRLLAERKYADSFEFEPYARLIFSANSPPQSSDASHAFFRRWLCVLFPRNFEPGQGARDRAELDAELAAGGELSGVLNMALAYLPKVRAQGITEAASMLEASSEFRAVTDPLAVWLDRETVADPHAVTPKQDLLRSFNAFCDRTGRPPMMDRAFGKALKRVRPDLQDTQRMVGGTKTWVWLAIGLRDERAETE